MEVILNSLKSKTVWGLIIAALGSTGWGSDLVATFELSEDRGVEIVDDIVTFVGLIIGYYGRVVAKEPLTSTTTETNE